MIKIAQAYGEEQAACTLLHEILHALDFSDEFKKHFGGGKKIDGWI